MCLVLIGYKVHPGFPLVLAANRDEYYDRPTAAAAWWEDAPGVFAGRDLVHGGTWLGIGSDGRLAALTNYRDPHSVKPDAPSRGALVSEFLAGPHSTEAYLKQLEREGAAYNGFNLLLGDPDQLYWYSNRDGRPVRLEPGWHGLSNHLLDTPWPKVVRGRDALAGVVQQPEFTREELFEILKDQTRAPDPLLPDTGVGVELERMLSSIFITSERYGTRSSTLLLYDREGRLTLVERSYNGGTGRDVEATVLLR